MQMELPSSESYFNNGGKRFHLLRAKKDAPDRNIGGGRHIGAVGLAPTDLKPSPACASAGRPIIIVI